MRSKTGNVKYYLFLFSILVYLRVSAQEQHSFLRELPPVPPTVSVASTLPVSFNSYLISFKVYQTSFDVLLPVSDTVRKKDKDGDGVVDSLDKCPDEKGAVQYDGCPIPDSDNDGIADDTDNCPTVAGLVKYKGCPAPDKDGDKINDEDDQCSSEPGVARYGGCPVGDKDGDGVNDDDDKCINQPGTSKNEGCPENKKSRATVTPEKKKKK
ncbi:thrombospondin type 3 repeat-containing protein [Segetibacter aerophilus]|uniref:Thrombospondin type 3 repeat-containing protein n=1 Tax=Segetibacter aerophilus TaxID=670293 RepID=A0A512B973_9BACT|nr:thrombospondin type 3 repeat-containing protein [Segetibacter aerophilus]GEO08524.1 hypothetical protein SAE01_10200 [Segetibacter aerophilus]